MRIAAGPPADWHQQGRGGVLHQGRAVDAIAQGVAPQPQAVHALAALQVAERIRATVEGTPFGADRGLQLTLSVSIGVATYPSHGAAREQLLDAADKAMYMAKALGRNQVCSANELSQPRFSETEGTE